MGAVLAIVFVTCLIGENLTNPRQWNLHRRKRAQVAAGAKAEASLGQTGLVRLAWHPNPFIELAQWWLLFRNGAGAAGQLLQCTGSAP